jgi:hypothetical protein
MVHHTKRQDSATISQVRYRREMARILLFAALMACYSPPQPVCGFVCGSGGACPPDYHCGNDHRCHLNGSPDSTMCAGPDAATPDAGVDSRCDIDAPPDAACPANHCLNAMLDCDETDVDCGGATCAKCMNNKRCLVDTDCISGHCTLMGMMKVCTP